MIGTLGEIPRRAAKAFGDRIALVDGGREFSFRDIDALSGTLGARCRCR
jgi:non-ribosomal peptide synthetase component E (peptide arylation enzyme)